MTEISEYDDVIDSRDILTRLAGLDEEYQDAETGEAVPIGEWDTGDRVEYEALDDVVRQLRDVGGDTPEDGMTLIRDSYFEDYAQELAEETADQDVQEWATQWPYRHIDWEAAARELQCDYTSITYAGVGYWTR